MTPRLHLVPLALGLLILGCGGRGSSNPPRTGAERDAASFAGRDAERVRDQLVIDFREWLETAPDFELLALHPEQTNDGEFHGYRVLGRAAIEDASERRALVEALYAGINANEGEEAECFLPRHGIRLSNDRRGRVDFVICFECAQVHVYGGYNHEELAQYVLIDPVAAPTFDASLKKHGLPKAGR